MDREVSLITARSMRLLVALATSLVLCYSATGGEPLQTLLLAVPLAAVFAISGFIGGLIAFCGSLAGVTGVYAVLDSSLSRAPIPSTITYLLVSIGAVGLSAYGSPMRTESGAYSKSSPTMLIAALPLLIAIFSGLVVLQWTRFSDLEFLTSLVGSEDNVAWISGTRTFVSGQMTTALLASFTNSPVTGVILGFFSDVYLITQPRVPEHLLALRVLRSAYALIIMMSAIAAGIWVSIVASRTKVSIWINCVASLTVAVAVLGSSLFLLVGFGFFSLINGVMFALVSIIGFEVAYIEAHLSKRSEAALILTVTGLSGAWMGAGPLSVSLVATMVICSLVEKRSRGKSKVHFTLIVVSWVLAAAVPIWTWSDLIWLWNKSSERRATDLIGYTGTVPIVTTGWIPIIFLVIIALLVRQTGQRFDFRGRTFHLQLGLFVTMVWLASMLEYGEPRYAALKILALCSLLAMAGLGVVLVERIRFLGWQATLAGLALVMLWSSIVHESHNGIRGLGKNGSTNTYQARILDILDTNPNASIVCLHQDPESKIMAYLCSRFSTSFFPGRSQALDVWSSALLSSDISPDGIEISRVDHIGSRVLAQLQIESALSDFVVILVGGDRLEAVTKDLGPDFWWVSELDWSRFEIVRL